MSSQEDKLYFLSVSVDVMFGRITDISQVDDRKIKMLIGWDAYSTLTFRDLQSVCSDFIERLLTVSIDQIDIY